VRHDSSAALRNSVHIMRLARHICTALYSKFLCFHPHMYTIQAAGLSLIPTLNQAQTQTMHGPIGLGRVTPRSFPSSRRSLRHAEDSEKEPSHKTNISNTEQGQGQQAAGRIGDRGQRNCNGNTPTSTQRMTEKHDYCWHYNYNMQATAYYAAAPSPSFPLQCFWAPGVLPLF